MIRPVSSVGTCSRRSFIGGALGTVALLAAQEKLQKVNAFGQGIRPSGIPIGPSADPLDYLKTAISFGLSFIPEYGKVLSTIFGLLWTTQHRDVWDEIKDEVEALIDEKIGALEYALMEDKLAGIRRSMALFLLHADGGASGAEILRYFAASNVILVQSIGEMQSKAYSFVNAPLVAIASLLHLSPLREGLAHGRDWGLTEADWSVLGAQFDDTLTDYQAFFVQTIATKRTELAKSEPTGDEDQWQAYWNYWQQFTQRVTIAIDDFVVLFPFMDPRAHPQGTPRDAVPFKDVHTICYGTSQSFWDNSRLDLAYQVQPIFHRPLSGITSLDVTAAGDTWTVNVNYPSGEGPLVHHYDQYGVLRTGPEERVDATTVLAVPSTYNERLRRIEIPAIDGRTFSLQSARLSWGDIVQRFSLTAFDGTETKIWWGDEASGGTEVVEVPGRAMSSFTIWGHDTRYNNVPGGIIIGFSIDPTVQVDPSAPTNGLTTEALKQLAA